MVVPKNAFATRVVSFNTGERWTPVDDTLKEWDNGDGIVIRVEGDTTVTALYALCS